MTASPRVTVIMRTKNSDWVVAQTLAALFSQEFTDFELLIVDSGSTDGTLEIAAAYPCRIRHIAPEKYIPGAVLNEAIEQTETDLIVFLNSDTVLLSPYSLGHLIQAVENPKVYAAFGRQIPRPEAETWVRRDYRISFPAIGINPPWMPLSLPVAAMRRMAWMAHPFYTDAWGSEDTEWGVWARNAEISIAYVPQALAMHSHNYTLRQNYGRRFIEGEADAFIYRREARLIDFCKACILAFARETWEHLRVRDLRGLAAMPPRVVVSQWGYLQGLRLGARRRRTGDVDVQIGQQTVLNRHESVRKKEAGRL